MLVDQATLAAVLFYQLLASFQHEAPHAGGVDLAGVPPDPVSDNRFHR